VWWRCGCRAGGHGARRGSIQGRLWLLHPPTRPRPPPPPRCRTPLWRRRKQAGGGGGATRARVRGSGRECGAISLSQGPRWICMRHPCPLHGGGVTRAHPSPSRAWCGACSGGEGARASGRRPASATRKQPSSAGGQRGQRHPWCTPSLCTWLPSGSHLDEDPEEGVWQQAVAGGLGREWVFGGEHGTTQQQARIHIRRAGRSRQRW
jgi:hypothetical protein